MNDVDQEIEVIQNVITLLYQCLKISKETADTHAYKSCLKDIKTCEKELYRLRNEQLFIVAAKAKKGL